MTIGELLDVTPELCELDITIREDGHGRWVHGYEIGKYITVGQGYPEYRYDIEEGEKFDSRHRDGSLPKTFWAIDPHKATKDITSLEICNLQFTHCLMSWKYSKEITSWAIKCYILAYPKGWTPPKEQPKVDDSEQMDISQFIEGDTDV